MGKMDHVIVLMLENRSFDHMFGFLKHPNPKFEGLKGDESCPDQSDEQIKVSRDARYSIAGPDHSHAGIMQQLMQGNTRPPYTPTNKGFVQNYEERSPGNGHRIMQCFDPRMVPVLSTLALEFAVCTQWFCSVPGETWPNREFLHSGTSRGRADGGLTGLSSNQKTIFEVIEGAGNTWGIYHHDTPHTWCYPALWDTPFKRSRFNPIRKLYEDISKGHLPSYTFVEPDYGLADIVSGWGNSQHPDQAPSLDEFLGGERLIHRIYDALRNNPTLFEKTVFVITYDEHGGFYDHVPPLATDNPDGMKWKGQFDFNLLGVRVPTVIVSPWIKRHTIDRRLHDHTSIIQSLRIQFGKGQKPLTKRDANAIPFHDVLSNTLRPVNTLPVTLPLSAADGEKLEQKITGGLPPMMHALTDGGAMQDDFHVAMRALSASVGTRLALEANTKLITDAGLVSLAAAPGAVNPASNPAAVLQRFWASAEDRAPVGTTGAPAKAAPGRKKKAAGTKPTKSTKAIAAAAPTSVLATAAATGASAAAAPARSEIAEHVLQVLASLTGRTTNVLQETTKLEKDLGLNEPMRKDLSFVLSGIVRRYKQVGTSRDECGNVKTIKDAIDLVHGKTV